MDVKQVD